LNIGTDIRNYITFTAVAYNSYRFLNKPHSTGESPFWTTTSWVSPGKCSKVVFPHVHLLEGNPNKGIIGDILWKPIDIMGIHGAYIQEIGV